MSFSTKNVLFALGLALAPVAAGATCHHCPPEPTIGGEPQDGGGDIWMQNGVNYAEYRAANDKAIMNYTGWDPAIRFAQFIIWFAHTTGGHIPTEQDLRNQTQNSKQDSSAELVLAEGEDDLFGKHRLVVPFEKKGFIKDGQLAFVETQKGRYPLHVTTADSTSKGYGGYLVMSGYAPSGQPVSFGIPSGKDDLEWVYPFVRLTGAEPLADSSKLYSETGRGTKKR